MSMSIGPAFAQIQGYATDSRGTVVKDAYNLCWRTGYWTSAVAIAECDPEFVPKPAPRAAPAAPPPPVPPSPSAAPAPSPPPAPVAVQPPKPKRCDATVTMQTDESFAFNQTTLLNPAARTRLENEVRTRLAACTSLEAIIIEGHTDRLGSQEYNQKLSERRAEAAKEALVGMGVPADKIDILGMGKTLPVKSCPDSQYKTQQALVDCLAPNRRVVINIRGVGQ
jgi:OOP family OmpA-OmpF porin